MAYSRNVRVNVLLTCLGSAAQGFCWSTAAVTYLFLACGSSTVTVGVWEGAQGIVSVLVAFPAGWAADRWRRDTILRGCSAMTVLATAVLAVPVLHSLGWLQLSQAAQLPTIGVGLVLVGAAQGAGVPASDALLADSLETGEARTKLMVTLGAWRSLVSAAGSALLILTFWLLGNHWTERSLAVVMLAALSAGLLSAGLVWLYSDDRSLGESSDAVQDRTGGASAGASSTSPVAATQGTPQADEADEAGGCCGCGIGWIAPLLALAELVLCLGAGMTVKFWPIFFLDPKAAGLSPIEVNAVFCCATLVKAQLILVAKALAKKLASCCASSLGGDGRMESVVIFSLLGIGTRVVIAFTPQWWGNLPVIAALYILQTCLMNACHPLEKSVFMDFVSKAQRGRWAATDAVGMLGWSGSAAVGGWIIHTWGYSHLFLVTSTVQAIGLVPKLMVCLIIAGPEVQDKRRKAEAAAAAAAAAQAASGKEGSGGGGGGGGSGGVAAGALCCDRLLFPGAVAAREQHEARQQATSELQQPLI
jgi:MFS family permease